MTHGFVYVMRAGPYTKIGLTQNMQERIKKIQSCCPLELFEVFAVFTDAALRLERHMHDLFSHKRMHGEWFLLSEEEIDQLEEELQKAAMRSATYYVRNGRMGW